MNHWLDELMAYERQKAIQVEIKQIRMAEVYMAYRTGMFTRIMQGLGRWLIAKGEELLRRYESPKPRPPYTQSYVH